MLFEYNQNKSDAVFSEYLTSNQRNLLTKQGLKSAKDFLLFRPKRYDLRRYDMSFRTLVLDQHYSLIGKIRSILY